MPGMQMPNQDLSGLPETQGGAVKRAGKIGLYIFLAGAVTGLLFFAHYFRRGQTVAHYDAKAHLVVARSILDSAAPGYSRLGSHWLPLTHLLYLPLVAFESQYRSGLLPGLLSVFCFALSGWLTYRICLRATGSIPSGIFAAIFLLANTNLEYLQSCPLTEPVYMALMLLAMNGFLRWRDDEGRYLPWLPAAWASLGALCRYEGWFILGGILVVVGYDFCVRNMPRLRAAMAALVYLVTFAVPAALHFGYLYVRTGDNFLIRVAQGNPAPFETYRRPLLSLAYHGAELAQVAGIVPLAAGLAGVLYCGLAKKRLSRCFPLFLLWLPSLINISALYWGMIYRIRYSVLLVPAIAVFAAIAASDEKAARRVLLGSACLAAVLPWLPWFFPHEWRYHYFFAGPGVLTLPLTAAILFCAAEARGRYLCSLLAVCVLGMQVPVLAGERRPILAETGEHGFIESDRASILNYLRLHYDGTSILIDDQKLSPLIYDSQLPIRSFICGEGDPAGWRRVLDAPAGEAGWICIQKGDALAARLQVDPHMIDEYSLVVRNDWLSLYRLRPGRKPMSQ